jgi:hypothetical protein
MKMYNATGRHSPVEVGQVYAGEEIEGIVHWPNDYFFEYI